MHFPKEVLQNVATYLTESELNYALYLCGSESLTYKIRSAVTELRVTTPLIAPQRMQRLAFFPNILSLIVEAGGNEPLSLFRRLVEVMPSTLRKLHNADPRALKAFEVKLSNEDAQQLSCLAFRDYTSTTMVVSRRFPQLTYLYLGQDYYWSDPAEQWSEGMKIRFVAGLPTSLTYLYLPMLNLLSVAPWSLLPPNLQVLASNCQLTPRKPTLAKSLVASLTELTLWQPTYNRPRTRVDLKYDGTPFREGDEKTQLEPPWSVFFEFTMPSNLTRLTFTAKVELSRSPAVSFPSTLKWLKWEGSHSPVPDIGFLLALVPMSTTSLQLANFSLTSQTSSSPVPERPNLRIFEARDVSAPAHRLAPSLFKALPYVEQLELVVPTYVDLDSLRMLNPKTLTSLVTYVDPSFDSSLEVPTVPGGTPKYIFRTLLPNLTRLHLLSPQAPNRVTPKFNFAALPPSITDLKLGFLINATDLLDLPDAVEKLDIASVIVGNELSPTDFDRLFFPPDQDGELTFHDTFNFGTLHALERVTIRPRKGSTERPKSSFWFPQTTPGPTALWNINVTAPRLILTLPTTITHLKLTTQVLLPPETFSQRALPLLKSFIWESSGIWLEQLESFTSLEVLQMHSIPSRSHGGFPPNLKRLKLETSWYLQSPIGASYAIDNLVQIPRTIEHLEFDFFAPVSELLRQLPLLTHLKTLDVKTQQTQVAEAIMKHEVPRSLTKVHVAANHDLLLETLFNGALPHLRHLVYRGTFSWTQLNRIKALLGPEGILEGGMLSVNQGLVELTRMAELDKPGIIKNGSDDTSAHLKTFVDQVVQKAHPEWQLYYSIPQHEFSPSTWPTFATFLSPTLTKLDTYHYPLPPNFGAFLPPTLKTLLAHSIAAPQYQCTRHLPRSLTELTISCAGFGAPTLAELPPSITSLVLSDQRKFPPRFARAIPPSVTVLSLSIHSAPAISFQSLPPSVTRLQLYNQQMRGRIIKKIPDTIKQLCARDGAHNETYIGVAEQKQMPWILYSNLYADSALQKVSIESQLPSMLKHP